MNNYKDIIKDFLDKMHSKEYKINQKLPSEKAIAIKYNVSRIVASRVFFELRKIGAIYTIPKKGSFVAKFFQGLVKPISFEYDIDNYKDSQMENYEPESFSEYEIKGKFKTFKRTYFKDKKEIIVSENWINSDLIIFPEKNLVDMVTQQAEVVSSISITKFEINSKTKKEDLITYKILYFDKGIALVSRILVDKNKFKIIKQEFTI